MPRDLADVLHFFLPELDDSSDGEVAPEARARSRIYPEGPPRSAPREGLDQPLLTLPMIAVPIGQRDVLRAALVWNLSIEIARQGGCGVVVTPDSGAQSPLWPNAEIGPLGSELIRCPATNLTELETCALEIARGRNRSASKGGAIFLRVPPEWLDEASTPMHSVRWWLLLSSSHRRHLEDAFSSAQQVRKISPSAEIGTTIHGVESISEAKDAFERLARLCSVELQLDLKSYGLLVDDLDVYRAIAAQRPIGHARPQAPAAKALSDVARLIYEDARSQTLG